MTDKDPMIFQFTIILKISLIILPWAAWAKTEICDETPKGAQSTMLSVTSDLQKYNQQKCDEIKRKIDSKRPKQDDIRHCESRSRYGDYKDENHRKTCEAVLSYPPEVDRKMLSECEKAAKQRRADWESHNSQYRLTIENSGMSQTQIQTIRDLDKQHPNKQVVYHIEDKILKGRSYNEATKAEIKTFLRSLHPDLAAEAKVAPKDVDKFCGKGRYLKSEMPVWISYCIK